MSASAVAPSVTASPGTVQQPLDLSWKSINPLAALHLPANTGRLVVVAPHPDDETLGAGGLMHDLAKRGWDVQVVVASDGSASHPGVGKLAALRAREVARACRILGVTQPPLLLNFPDGAVGAHHEALTRELLPLVRATDIVVAPRRGDGHADHEATALAVDDAMSVCGHESPALWKYAIWAWERFDPNDEYFHGAFVHRASPDAIIAKANAINAHRSQTTSVLGDVILSPAMLARFAGPCEVFWC